MINKQMYQFPISYANVHPFGKIAVGWGAHTTVANECKAVNIKKALIVTTGLKGTGIVDEINQILTTNGVATEIYDKVTSNPKDHEVMAGYKVFKEAGCDGVVSVGGGSSHDCGKGIRIVACNDGTFICDLSADNPDADRKKIAEAKPVVTLPLERYNEGACPDKFAEMARAMGVDTRGMTKMQAADKWFEEVERLLADLNITTGHLKEQFGLQHQDLEEIAARCSNFVYRFGNPREISFEVALKLLEDLM